MGDDGVFRTFGRVLEPSATETEDEVTDETALSDDATPGFTPYTGEPGAGTGTADAGAGEPSAAELARIERAVRAMIAEGRKYGWTLAAENLEDWLTGNYEGGTKTLASRWFDSEEFVAQHLRTEHRERVLVGAERRLQAGPNAQFPASTTTLLCGRRTVGPEPNTLLPSGPDDVGRETIYWQDSVTAPSESELFYALGGFTLLSTVTLAARQVTDDPADGWVVDVEDWAVEVCDRYNWDKGKATLVPLFGKVQDADMAKLERHGDAAPYDVVSKPWTVTDPAVTGSFAINP